MEVPSWRLTASTWLRFFLGLRLGPYHPMPDPVIAEMLRLARVSELDVLYDVGCGDGRVLMAAALQCRVREGVGLELNGRLCEMARANVRAFSTSHPHLSSTLSILHTDARQADLSPASVLTLYLSERGNRQLKPLLARHLLSRSDSRAASFCFNVEGWRPVRVAKVCGIPLLLYTADSVDSQGRREVERERDKQRAAQVIDSR